MWNRVGQDYTMDPYVLARELQRNAGGTSVRLDETPIPLPAQGPSPFERQVNVQTFPNIDVFAPGTTPTPGPPPPADPKPGDTGTPPAGGITERIQAGVLKEIGIALLLTSPAWIPIFVLPMFRARR